MKKKLLITGAVLLALAVPAYPLFGVGDFVIDILAETRLYSGLLIQGDTLTNIIETYQLAQMMASEVTHAEYWKRLAWGLISHVHVDLYGETGGWDEIYTGGPIEAGWGNATVTIHPDPTYTGGPSTPYASQVATVEIADSAIQDSLSLASEYYGGKDMNDQAVAQMAMDILAPENDTFLAQAKIGAGANVQVLTTQQEELTHLVGLERLLAIQAKAVRDQAVDAVNYQADVHAYQMTKGVEFTDPTTGFQQY